MDKRKFFLVFLGILLTFILCAFTWDSEISPNEIGSWESLKTHSRIHNIYHPSFMSLVVENTGKKGKIYRALILISYDQILLGYSYFVEGIQKIYVFYPNTEQYKLGEIQDKNMEYVKKNCLECHSKDFCHEEKEGLNVWMKTNLIS